MDNCTFISNNSAIQSNSNCIHEHTLECIPEVEPIPEHTPGPIPEHVPGPTPEHIPGPVPEHIHGLAPKHDTECCQHTSYIIRCDHMTSSWKDGGNSNKALEDICFQINSDVHLLGLVGPVGAGKVCMI